MHGMPPRATPYDLTKLLDGLDDPTYVVDDRRRIVFINKACAAWTGRTVDELLGRECRYRTQVAEPGTSEIDPAAATADALCPPPSSLAGFRSAGEIVLPAAVGATPLARRGEFIPLGVTPVGAAAVLVWLPTTEIAERLVDDDRRGEQESQRLHALTAKVRRDFATRYAPARLLGVSPAIERVRRQIALAAASEASVLVVGPAGVGKGHVARTIHAARSAAGHDSESAALAPLDAPTLNAELLQAAIRNLARSSTSQATAATNMRRRGCLLLQNVERMPTDAQVELAGFLRLGDFPLRLIATSDEPLAAAVADGRFRADLAAWLSTLVIELPALAARPEDLPSLAQHFVEAANASGDKQLGGCTSDALDLLAQYAWPGNVAELAEMIAAACATAEGPLVAARDLPRRLHLAADAERYAARPDETIVLDEYLAEIEKELLRRALQRAKGNKTRAARLVGLTRPRFYRRLVQLGLEDGPVVFEEATGETAPPDEDS